MDPRDVVGYGYSAETALISLHSCLVYNLGKGLCKSDDGTHWYINEDRRWQAAYTSQGSYFKFSLREVTPQRRWFGGFNGLGTYCCSSRRSDR
jgi:hypothetical protein